MYTYIYIYIYREREICPLDNPTSPHTALVPAASTMRIHLKQDGFAVDPEQRNILITIERHTITRSSQGRSSEVRP